MPSITTPPAQMLAAMDAWAVTMMGLYETETTTRHAEHACMRELRRKGVIK